jgi:hypothetical protein
MLSPRPRPRQGSGSDSIRGRQPHGVSTNERNPLFDLSRTVEGFAVGDCTRDEKAAFADRLQHLARMTWTQILMAGRTGAGSETIAQASLNVPIPGFVTPDRRLLTLRFGDAARIIGFREDAVLHIIWIDPHHRAYDG